MINDDFRSGRLTWQDITEGETMNTPTLEQTIDYLARDWHTIQVSTTKKARLHRNASFSGAISLASALFDRPQAELVEAAISRSNELDKAWEEPTW